MLIVRKPLAVGNSKFLHLRRYYYLIVPLKELLASTFTTIVAQAEEILVAPLSNQINLSDD